MKSSRDPAMSRRRFLKGSAAMGALSSLPFAPACAKAQERIHFATWSAAVDQVKSHVNAFEEETGIAVAYENAPGAQFRQILITKFVSGAPLDVMWVNDAWLPEFSEAGWIAPVDQYPSLMKYNDDLRQYCIDSMTYQGRQYGNVYYTDFMGFLYNQEILGEAGISAPPETWEEVVEQSLEIKEKGLCDYPMLISLEADAWMVEFISSLVFSFGGRFVDGAGKSIMQDPQGGATAALEWLQDAIHKHEIISPGAASTQEMSGLKAFGAGQHAFGIIPRYRSRPLNNPAESQVAGKVRMALMPRGPDGTHATCGWVRFYGMTTAAQRDQSKAENVVKLIEWFGGKALGEYRFQKMLMLDLGVPFCTTSLESDPDIVAFHERYLGGGEIVSEQAGLVVEKDVITPWFAEWNEINSQAWQKAVLNQTTATEALTESGEAWDRLKAAY